jgi:hypothetical protein
LGVFRISIVESAEKKPEYPHGDYSGFIAWEELRQRNSIWYVADFIEQVACQLF